MLRCKGDAGLGTVTYAPVPPEPASALDGDEAQGTSLVRPRRPAGRCGPPPTLGHFVPIEHEHALDHFHRALRRLAAGDDEDGKVRILAYGASHTQSDLYTGYLRAYLQRRFGNGGQGFVLLGRVNRWYRTLDTGVWHRGLSVRHARFGGVEDEPLGLFGAAAVGRRGDAFAEIITGKSSENTQFEVHYFNQPKGGSFTLSVDGRRVRRVWTAADVLGSAHCSFEATPGRHAIRVRLNGDGPVRLFGITAETIHPGVVVDTLGINGARMDDALRWSEDVWIEAVRRRRPDLVTFAYGTNEAMSGLGSVDRYEQAVRAVLSRLRKAAPEASCLLISPFDVSKHEKGRRKAPADLSETIDAQRRVAGEMGCGFWDGRAFMGGEGSMASWINAKPPLAGSDGIHLTRLGYVYAGIGLGDALMRVYDLPHGSMASLTPRTTRARGRRR